MRLLPTETHIAYHLMSIGALTPVVVRQINLDTILKVPVNKTPEYNKTLVKVGISDTVTDFELLKTVESIQKPNVKISSEIVRRVYQYMTEKSMWVNLWGGWNIVYLEGAFLNKGKTNFYINNDSLDFFNDIRMIFKFTEHGSEHYAWEATTEPGRFYTQNPLRKEGVARIAFGQQRAWVKGTHAGKQNALIQKHPVLLHRDFNKDGFRTNDLVELCNGCGINHHTTESDTELQSIGKWSAGCMVGEKKSEHRYFMASIVKDYRFYAGYEFLSTVLDASRVV